MKNLIKKIFVSAFLVCTVYGCDEVLEPEIFSQINASIFPQTESDVVSALIPFYAQFNQNYGVTDPTSGIYNYSFNAHFLGYSWATSSQTDEGFYLFNDYPVTTFDHGSATYSTNESGSFYDRISSVARMTGLIDTLEKSDINNSERYIAEIKALRAWFMYILYDAYGPVSVRLNPENLNSDTSLPRPTKEAYVEAMVNDLEDAIEVLPARYNNTQNWGRVSAGVAKMLLMKVHLHEKNWADVLTVGQDIIDMGYSLNSSYKNVFTQTQNNEVIFAVPANPVDNNIWFACILDNQMKSVLGVNVDSGSKYRLQWMPWDFYDTYTAGDTRLETIAAEYTNFQDNIIGRNQGLGGAIPLKYTNYAPSDVEGFDLVLFRFSDVLLAMAEATNELDGPTSAAQGFLTRVTDRANTTANIPASAFLTKESFREFILAERGRELYWEFGIRRQDLIRNGSFIEKAKERGFTNARDGQVLFPIPANVIIESGGIITQNPDY